MTHNLFAAIWLSFMFGVSLALAPEPGPDPDEALPRRIVTHDAAPSRAFIDVSVGAQIPVSTTATTMTTGSSTFYAAAGPVCSYENYPNQGIATLRFQP